MKRLLIVSLGLIFTLALHAQNNLPDNFFFKKLDNGLEILVIEDRSVPLATIELCVKNGAYTESPEYDGLSHLYEHMFFKANKELPSQEAFMKKVRELGVVFNGTTSEERVNYFITLQNQNLVAGLEFMNNAVRYPLFLKEEMVKENPVVDGEFQRAESSPTWFLFNEMNRQLWGDLYSRKNVIGDHDIINTATPEKMQEIQQKFYYPNNSLMAVAGDIDHDVVFEEIGRIMGDWKAADFDPHVKYPIPSFAPLKSSQQFVVESELSQVPIIMMSLHGPDTKHDLNATYAADVFSFILRQQSSKFHQALVESGLAFNADCGYQTLMHIGPINIFLVANPEHAEKAYKELINQISMWADDDYFTDDQMQTAKNMLAIDDAYGKEKVSQYVHTLTYWWASADIDYYTSYVENLQKVTREDITRYVNMYIKGQPYVSGLLINPDQKMTLETENWFKETKSFKNYSVEFENKMSSISMDIQKSELNSLFQKMEINPDLKLEITAYYDQSEKKTVGKKRLANTVKYLVGEGLSEDRISGKMVVMKETPNTRQVIFTTVK